MCSCRVGNWGCWYNALGLAGMVKGGSYRDQLAYTCSLGWLAYTCLRAPPVAHSCGFAEAVAQQRLGTILSTADHDSLILNTCTQEKIA